MRADLVSHKLFSGLLICLLALNCFGAFVSTASLSKPKLVSDEGKQGSPFLFFFFLVSSAHSLIIDLNFCLVDCEMGTVKTLREIGKRLGKRDWDFKVDPCSGEGNWNVPDTERGFDSSVSCDCSFDNNSTCHVVSMYAFPLIFICLFAWNFEFCWLVLRSQYGFDLCVHLREEREGKKVPFWFSNPF